MEYGHLMARRSNGESALRRHLRVLGAFDTRHPFLTLREVATRASLPVSTAHRLLRELEQEGLVERAEDRAYRLGVRLYEFASRTPGALGLRELARPHLSRVQATIRQHAQIGVVSGLDILTIDKLSARDAIINGSYIGGRVPLAISCGGLVLLANGPSSKVDEVIAAGLPARTEPLGRQSVTEFRRTLRRVKLEGFAVTDGWIHAESRGVAVPVWGPHRTVYAALSVVVPVEDSSVPPIVETLMAASARITRALEEAYLPHDGHGVGLRPLVATSSRSLEYLESLEG